MVGLRNGRTDGPRRAGVCRVREDRECGWAQVEPAGKEGLGGATDMPSWHWQPPPVALGKEGAQWEPGGGRTVTLCSWEETQCLWPC